MHLERYADARLVLEEVATFALSANRRSDVQCHLGRCYFELGLYAMARLQFRQPLLASVTIGVLHFTTIGATLYIRKESSPQLEDNSFSAFSPGSLDSLGHTRTSCLQLFAVRWETVSKLAYTRNLRNLPDGFASNSERWAWTFTKSFFGGFTVDFSEGSCLRVATDAMKPVTKAAESFKKYGPPLRNCLCCAHTRSLVGSE